MKNGEIIKDYISRLLTIVYQIRALGDDLTNKSVVAKIRRV